MKKRFLALMALLAVSGGMARAQEPSPQLPDTCPAFAPVAARPTVPLNESASPPDNQMWVNAEYLLWWVKGSQMPPLVATGSSLAPLTQTSVAFPFLLPAASLVTLSTAPAPFGLSTVLVGKGF